MAHLVPSADYQVQLISAVVDLGSLRECRQAGIAKDHFTQWPDAWSFIEQHNRRFGKPPSRLQLETRFPRAEFPRDQGGEIECLIGQVRSQWLYDQISDVMASTVQMMVSQDHEPIDALHYIQSKTQLLQLQHGSDNHDLDLIRSEGLVSLLDTAVRRRAAQQDPTLRGISTGFREFDNSTGGLEDSELVVVLARVTQGKSWALLYMAAKALMQGKKVLFFPLEMSLAQIGFRLHVILQAEFTRQFPEEMRNVSPFLNTSLNQGTGYSFPSYKQFLDLLETKLEGSFTVSESPGKFTPSHVMTKIQEHKPDVVYIDYLTLMQSDSGRELEGWQDIKLLTKDLKAMAMSQHVPIITAAQANRTSTSRKSVPELADIAFGDAIGQDADRVLSLRQLSRRVTRCVVIKNRHGDSRGQSYLEHSWNHGRINEVNEDRAMDLLAEDEANNDLISDRAPS